MRATLKNYFGIFLKKNKKKFQKQKKQLSFRKHFRFELCAWGLVVVMQSVSTGICWPVSLVEMLKADS